MKGSNVLKLNQQTMCEALQTWVKETFAGPNQPTVMAVKSSGTRGTYGTDGDEFEVTVENKETTNG